tara:strand:- start:2193 stop:2309 length:117 start_codon:yes stop_codon:yes gene_type:complete
MGPLELNFIKNAITKKNGEPIKITIKEKLKSRNDFNLK